MLAVNLDGAFLIAKVFGSHLAKKPLGGGLLFLSSIYGLLGTDHSIYESSNSPSKRLNNPAAYSASKGGVINLVRYLATYWAEQNVTVNSLSLGGVANGQPETFVDEYSKEMTDALALAPGRALSHSNGLVFSMQRLNGKAFANYL